MYLRCMKGYDSTCHWAILQLKVSCHKICECKSFLNPRRLSAFTSSKTNKPPLGTWFKSKDYNSEKDAMETKAATALDMTRI